MRSASLSLESENVGFLKVPGRARGFLTMVPVRADIKSAHAAGFEFGFFLQRCINRVRSPRNSWKKARWPSTPKHIKRTTIPEMPALQATTCLVETVAKPAVFDCCFMFSLMVRPSLPDCPGDRLLSLFNKRISSCLLDPALVCGESAGMKLLRLSVLRNAARNTLETAAKKT